jgi:hypothetical protein
VVALPDSAWLAIRLPTRFKLLMRADVDPAAYAVIRNHGQECFNPEIRIGMLA